MHMRFEPNSAATGNPQLRDRARTWPEIIRRVFGVNPNLDGTTVTRNVRLSEGKLFPRSDANLLLDQIDSSHLFGDGMLNLNPGVDLDKVKVVVLIDDEFDRAGVVVIDGANEPCGRVADRGAGNIRQIRGRRFLDQLLVFPLRRAVTLPEVNDIALLIGDHLHFDVPWIFDIFFEVHASVIKGFFGLLSSPFQSRSEFIVIAGHPHSFAAPASCRLDEHRVADARSKHQGFRLALNQTVAARHDRDAGSHRHLPGCDFVTELFHAFVWRADEFDFAFAADSSELGILSEEAVSRMNSLRTTNLGCRNDFLDAQIALASRSGSDAVFLVRELEVMCATVGLTEDRNRLDA